MLKSTLIKLHAAAVFFTQRNGCSAKEIADTFNFPLNSVYHYAKQPEWEETLDTLGYTGDRQFTRKKTRDALKDRGELVAQAKALYINHRQQGHKKADAIRYICETLNLPQRTIYDWVNRYDWEAML